MIESFFQSLNSGAIEYLLISGQATVLYGAATFSEDIDLWINPTPENAERFRTVLRASNARFYKLTPPWEPKWLERGHGFHFVLPESGGSETYLDVMGAPPRVSSFPQAVQAAQWMETDWGRVRVIGIQQLIELKKTQRLEDYPVIGRLALIWLQQLSGGPKPEDYRWALQQIFTLPELHLLGEQHPAAAGVFGQTGPAPLAKYFAALARPSEHTEAEVATFLQSRIADLQAADRHYWRGIIGELRQLRQQGLLVTEGTSV